MKCSRASEAYDMELVWSHGLLLAAAQLFIQTRLEDYFQYPMRGFRLWRSMSLGKNPGTCSLFSFLVRKTLLLSHIFLNNVSNADPNSSFLKSSMANIQFFRQWQVKSIVLHVCFETDLFLKCCTRHWNGCYHWCSSKLENSMAGYWTQGSHDKETERVRKAGRCEPIALTACAWYIYLEIHERADSANNDSLQFLWVLQGAYRDMYSSSLSLNRECTSLLNVYQACHMAPKVSKLPI